MNKIKGDSKGKLCLLIPPYNFGHKPHNTKKEKFFLDFLSILAAHMERNIKTYFLFFPCKFRPSY